MLYYLRPIKTEHYIVHVDVIRILTHIKMYGKHISITFHLQKSTVKNIYSY